MIVLFIIFLNLEKSNKNIILLSSTLSNKESELIYLDKDFKTTMTTTLNYNGFTEIEKNSSSIELISPYNSYFAHIKDTKTSIMKSRYPSPIFNIRKNDTQLIIYNYDELSDINYYTYELITLHSKGKVRLKGIPISAFIENNLAYIYTRDMSLPNLDEQFSLQILDLHNKNNHKSISVNAPIMVNDIAAFDTKLFLVGMNMSNSDSTVIEFDMLTEQITTFKYLYSGIQFIEKVNDNYLIVFNDSDHTHKWVYYNESFAQSTELDSFQGIVSKVKVDQDFAYYISSISNENFLNRYNLKEKKNLFKKQIPLTVTDFLIN
ncbi:hypothetical protein ACFO0S_07170 [Chryseomicrobium palamuruense]|uniref:Uncharacterized protein n=1 Tax=Chryseomicrobium palamuruense TaxID=682973 RepID=A0ABV8UU20_9BACL